MHNETAADGYREHQGAQQAISEHGDSSSSSVSSVPGSDHAPMRDTVGDMSHEIYKICPSVLAKIVQTTPTIHLDRAKYNAHVVCDEICSSSSNSSSSSSSGDSTSGDSSSSEDKERGCRPPSALCRTHTAAVTIGKEDVVDRDGYDRLCRDGRWRLLVVSVAGICAARWGHLSWSHSMPTVSIPYSCTPASHVVGSRVRVADDVPDVHTRLDSDGVHDSLASLMLGSSDASRLLVLPARAVAEHLERARTAHGAKCTVFRSRQHASTATSPIPRATLDVSLIPVATVLVCGDTMGAAYDKVVMRLPPSVCAHRLHGGLWVAGVSDCVRQSPVVTDVSWTAVRCSDEKKRVTNVATVEVPLSEWLRDFRSSLCALEAGVDAGMGGHDLFRSLGAIDAVDFDTERELCEYWNTHESALHVGFLNGAEHSGAVHRPGCVFVQYIVDCYDVLCRAADRHESGVQCLLHADDFVFDLINAIGKSVCVLDARGVKRVAHSWGIGGMPCWGSPASEFWGVIPNTSGMHDIVYTVYATFHELLTPENYTGGAISETVAGLVSLLCPGDRRAEGATMVTAAVNLGDICGVEDEFADAMRYIGYSVTYPGRGQDTTVELSLNQLLESEDTTIELSLSQLLESDDACIDANDVLVAEQMRYIERLQSMERDATARGIHEKRLGDRARDFACEIAAVRQRM
jgi:hypothetical protein